MLCNLDADNLLANGFAAFLNQEFSADRNLFVRPNKLETLFQTYTGHANRGVGGRIALTQESFSKVRGYRYSEAKDHWGADDGGLANALLWQGVRKIGLGEYFGSAILHDDNERTQFLSATAKA